MLVPCLACPLLVGEAGTLGVVLTAEGALMQVGRGWGVVGGPLAGVTVEARVVGVPVAVALVVAAAAVAVRRAAALEVGVSMVAALLLVEG